MNSYKHAHISGVLLSLDDNGGDYYLLGIAVRNVAEWVASQPSLPNNLQLLYHLPIYTCVQRRKPSPAVGTLLDILD